MAELVIPNLNTNDDSCVLVEWLYGDGDQVGEDDIVAVVETSKATNDVLAEQGGVLHRVVPAGTECKFGTVIGHLFGSDAERQEFAAAGGGAVVGPVGTSGGPVLTDSARDLVERHGITTEALLALGRSVVRGPDVERLVAGAGTRTLSRNQRAVGEVVSRSRASIPAAFTSARIDAGPALELRRRLRAERGVDVGLPALLIRALARCRDQHPLFFATLSEGGRVSVPDEVHVGVTVDAGAGLFVPVVRSAAAKSAVDIAAELTGFHRLAVGGRFSDAELTEGSVTVSLSPYKDVLLVVPIVFPGQACAVSLSGLADEVALDAQDRPVRRKTAVLGIAYDHRLVNGRDAAGLLRSVKAELGSAAALRSLVD